jgi:hypothetical protein
MEKMTMKTTTLFILGVALFIFGAWIIGLGIIGKSPVTVILGACIFAFSFLPLFTSGTVEIEDAGVSVTTLLGRHFLRWEEAKTLLAGNGNVLIGAADGRRLVVPAPSYWKGPKRNEAMKQFFLKLQERELAMKPDWRASFLFSKGTRVR